MFILCQLHYILALTTLWLVNVGKEDFLSSPINFKPSWPYYSLYAMKCSGSITKIEVVVVMLSAVENWCHCGVF